MQTRDSKQCDTNVLPIYAKWNFPLLSIGPVHFRLNGCWVVVFIQISIEHFVDSGDTDQAPRSTATGLGLHCLPVCPTKRALG